MGFSQSVIRSQAPSVIKSQAPSVIKSQAPAKCGICDTDRSIKWKCIDCSKLLCDHCKEKVHPQFQNAKDHQVVNIKDVGQPTVVELKINKQYQTGLPAIGYMSYCDDDSLWICNTKDKVLQRVKPEGTKLKIISSFNIEVYGIAVTQSNNLLISMEESRLKQINSKTGALTDPVYDVTPFVAIAVHITSDNKVLVGCGDNDRICVILMNQTGDHERVYEHDQHKQPIFTYPWSITSTRNGNIHVVDRVSDDIRRVVVLGQGGDIINVYTGDTEINKDRPFEPTDIVTTPRDNVIVADPGTHTLHILNNAGMMMTYYKTSDINIRFPCSLALSPTGQLYIGCARPEDSTEHAKIYEVTVSGC
ncbi:Hypothetical predicted protein [Mytilus galloprovincialis]|uniref:B box-type domain-containing protein n=1 Tax=Mytilus galloprovincialis TaxID=29158 RepID=A0A8B6GBG3_MYTGA|nr:Hypothetical predicted protein [Mytilus galloprovincialis]